MKDYLTIRINKETLKFLGSLILIALCSSAIMYTVYVHIEYHLGTDYEEGYLKGDFDGRGELINWVISYEHNFGSDQTLIFENATGSSRTLYLSCDEPDDELLIGDGSLFWSGSLNSGGANNG